MQYRAFFFDGAGRIEKSHEFEASTDKAAIQIAAAWREGNRAELWQRDRRVMAWDADDRID